MKTITLTIVSLLFSFLINAQSVATYNITFTNFWNEADHSMGTTFPTNAHWSKLVGANHNSSVTFLEKDETATQGIENIAEEGNNNYFKNNEVLNNINAEQYIDGDDLTLSNGNIIEIIGLEVSEAFPLLTLVSMIAPSPDWMVYINGINLRNAGNTGWINLIEIDLYPYDAGTEDGNDYDTDNSASMSQGVITSLQDVAPFNNQKVARLNIEFKSVLSVDNNTLNEVRIFPNPVKDKLTLTNLKNKDVENIEIYNILGTSILSRKIEHNLNTFSLNIESINNGVYLLKLTGKQGHTKTQKLVIQ